MKINKLFHVLVVTGASTTVGLAACSSSDSGSGGTTGGTGAAAGTSSGGTTSSAGHSGSTASGGATATGGGGGATAMGGSGGAHGGAGGATGGSGGAPACNLVASSTKTAACMGYLDDANANGCCCWISAAKGPGRCTEPGCASTDTCCAGHVVVQ